MKGDVMTVTELIDLMIREGSVLAKPVVVEGMPDMTFDCWFAPQGASPMELAELYDNLPLDITEFWEKARTARLFEDQVYGQWGLEIFDPREALDTTRQCKERRTRDYLDDDLVVGRFLGDSDLLVVRNDPTSIDFGTVIVALPIDPRADWYHVSKSFGEFLESFVNSGGEKYWANS
jgi:hypothetical protein